MKLAEALQERADLNRKLDELRDRLSNNVIVQEGEKPLEDPNGLLEQFDAAVARLEELMARINATNAATFDDGESVTALIARKDALSQQVRTYRNVVNWASQTGHRARGTEIRVISAINVHALQKKTDDLAAELRRTDNRIQELNWKTELL
ncbi:MAG: DIP1984 family protein [Oscillospiraceae bacterium]|nr:DIP1984 family protein [Oscillospiraceae bacterium]